MSETSSPETPPPVEQPKSSCRKKRAFRIFAAAAILLLVVLPVGLYFCPWFLSLHAGARGQRIALIETRLNGIDNRLTSLEAKLHDVSAPPSSQPPSSAMQADSSAKPADLAHMQSDLVALSAAVAGLQSEVKQTSVVAEQTRDATRTMLAAAIGFMQLRDAVLSGRPFTSELASLRIAVGDDASFQEPLAKLEPYAAQGAPTFSQLRDQLLAQEAGAANSIEKAQAQNWWQRVLAELKGLVSIRPLHGNEQADAFAALGTALQKDDGTGAQDAFNALPAEAQRSLGDFHSKLAAKASVDGALHSLAAHFTSPAGQVTP